jgi:hypothetical protein
MTDRTDLLERRVERAQIEECPVHVEHEDELRVVPLACP